MNGWADNLSEDETGQNKGLIEGGKTKTHQANIEQNGEKGERDAFYKCSLIGGDISFQLIETGETETESVAYT